MDTITVLERDTQISSGWTQWFARSPVQPEAVPAYLNERLPGVEIVLREWTEYLLEVPGATALMVGNVVYLPRIPDEHFFAIQFTNRLGVTHITPMNGPEQGTSLIAEVIAAKFSSIDESLQFTQAIVDEIAGHVAQMPFVVTADTLRHSLQLHGDPGLFFTFHYLRHHGVALRTAIQIILADPQRALTDIVERTRIASARTIDAEALQSLLTGPRAEVRARPEGASPLERLQPLHIIQRRPEETYDTPENRFVVAAATRVLKLLAAIRAQWWWEKQANDLDRELFESIERLLRRFLRADPWKQLRSALRVPAYSRVLQNRAGYRELTRFWNGLTRIYVPVVNRLDQAIDLRDVPTLYEYWLFFALSAEIGAEVGVPPTYHLNEDVYPQSWAMRSVFPGFGALQTQRSFAGARTYTPVALRPDFVWESAQGDLVLLDAKFAMSSVGEFSMEETDVVTSSHATSRDIVKMHAYRDAIAEVRAALVLFPGTDGGFWSEDADGNIPHISGIEEVIDRIIAGDLSGIGAVPMRPIVGG